MHRRQAHGRQGRALVVLLIAAALSLVWFIAAASLDHPTAATVTGLLLVRPDGLVFFANANPLRLSVLHLVGTTGVASFVCTAGNGPANSKYQGETWVLDSPEDVLLSYSLVLRP